MMKYIIVSAFTLLSLGLFSQIGGNQLYGNSNQSQNRYQNRNPTEKKSIFSTESALVVNAMVLLNKEADYYSITIGVSQEAKTVSECIDQINRRINNSIKGFGQIGVKNEDIALDFISETKMYDHKIEGKEITEILVGYEVKKNIILRTKDLGAIEKIINICSKQEIYDIIKVDYFNDDVEAINEQLFKQAMAIIKSKKERFVNNSSIKLSSKHRIVSDNFRTFYPKNLYKKYSEAFETSTVSTNYSNYNSTYIRKDIRKSSTYYYDGIEYEISVDKTIDEVSPTVGIQYVMEIQMIYELEK
jgi:uncharacterized protein YggE